MPKSWLTAQWSSRGKRIMVLKYMCALSKSKSRFDFITSMINAEVRHG